MSEHREPAQPGAVQGAGAWRRLARMGSPRLTKANVLVLALAVLLGFAISTQVHQTRASGLESLRQEELVGVLDTVTQEGVRLGTELRTLERTRDRLASGADSEKEAVELARARADTLALLAGTEPATGPGVRLTITDPSGKIGATILLDAIQELRDAGAEVDEGVAVSVHDHAAVGVGHVDGDRTRHGCRHSLRPPLGQRTGRRTGQGRDDPAFLGQSESGHRHILTCQGVTWSVRARVRRTH